MPEPGRGDARERLLAAVLAYASRHGLADVSLRRLADAVGTSHRMLLYHFGSRDGLLAAVAAHAEALEQDVLSRLDARTAGSPVDVARAVWAHLADHTLLRARIFFEVAAQAAQRRPHTEEFAAAYTDRWLGPMTALSRRTGRSPAAATAHARLAVATCRGLLLDLLVTGDRAAVDAAAEEFFRTYEPVGPPR